MSSQETFTEPTDFSSEQAITIQPSGIATYAGPGDWPAAGDAGEAHHHGVGPETILHALRRNFLVVLATGLAAAVIIGVAVGVLLKPKYEAKAVLVIAPKNPLLLTGPSADESSGVADEFNIFRGNQQNLLKEHFVLQAALRDSPKLKNLPSIQREDAKHNAINWLASVIQVDLPKNAGIMNVSVSLPDAKEATVIVNAVVDAYMDQVVNGERAKRRERFESCSTSPRRKRTKCARCGKSSRATWKAWASATTSRHQCAGKWPCRFLQNISANFRRCGSSRPPCWASCRGLRKWQK